MVKHRNLLFAIADGEHLRLVRPAADNALHTERAIDSATAHLRSADLGSDKPGESFHSDSTAHHGLAPRHDPHAQEEEKFAHFAAATLNQTAEAGGFDELVLVAPAHTLARIEAKLSAVAAAKLTGRLAKDLVKTPDHELQPHLHEWVHPIHRAP